MTDLAKLEVKINYKFQDKKLLKLALTHRSSLGKASVRESNERLEFLGDAVLELIITKHLYHEYPQYQEGILTNIRSAVVCRSALAQASIALDLGDFMLMSKGELMSGGHKNEHLLANTFEALLGAIYLDGGAKPSQALIAKLLFKMMKQVVKDGAHIDDKSSFQAYAQDIYGITPHYELVSESGADHKKEFVLAVCIGDEQIAEGKGSSKKRAQMAAARNGLQAKKWV